MVGHTLKNGASRDFSIYSKIESYLFCFKSSMIHQFQIFYDYGFRYRLHRLICFVWMIGAMIPDNWLHPQEIAPSFPILLWCVPTQKSPILLKWQTRPHRSSLFANCVQRIRTVLKTWFRIWMQIQSWTSLK